MGSLFNVDGTTGDITTAGSITATGGDITLPNQHAVIFKEQTGNGVDSITLEAADDVTTSYTLKLPPAVASAGQVLTDAAGNGVLSWTTVSGSSGITQLTNDVTAGPGSGSQAATCVSVTATTGGSSLASGKVGEQITSFGSLPGGVTTNTYTDITHIILPAGNWAVSAYVQFYDNQAPVTLFQMGIGTVAGNDATGLTNGQSALQWTPPPDPTGIGFYSVATIPQYPLYSSSTQTYYLKAFALYASSGPPTVVGTIRAYRVQ